MLSSTAGALIVVTTSIVATRVVTAGMAARLVSTALIAATATSAATGTAGHRLGRTGGEGRCSRYSFRSDTAEVESTFDRGQSQDQESRLDDGARFAYSAEAGHKKDDCIPEQTPETNDDYTFAPGTHCFTQSGYRPYP